MKNLVSTIALLACCLTLTQCGGGGGGGGGGDGSASTVRPKTLDGLVLTLGGNVRFRFVRTMGSPAAVANGDVETGTFFYTLGGVQVRTYPNTASGNSDTRFPDTVAAATYTYRAINNSSGVLTLTAVGSSDLVDTGRYNANNGSFVYLFENDSNFVTNNVVVVDLTFTETGTTAVANSATVAIPGGDPLYDTVIIPAAISLVSGGPVPTNYNPTLDPDRPSEIAPESLNNKRFQFTNGSANPNLDFTIQFVADTGSSTPSNIDEIGMGLLRVSGTAVDNAVDYTYTRTGGTDDAILVVSGSGTTFDGRYTLRFGSAQSGAYIGEVDGDTVDAADVTGTFTVVATPSP